MLSPFSILVSFLFLTTSLSLSTGDKCSTTTPFRAPYPNPTLYGPNDPTLVSSTLMTAVQQSEVIDIPFSVLDPFFQQTENWCYWNGLFGVVKDHLKVGDSLEADFNVLPNISWPEGTELLPPSIRLVNITAVGSEYAWVYQFSSSGEVLEFGRHNYGLFPTPEGKTCFASWEKAAGSSMEKPSVAAEIQKTLECATDAAMDGARCLEYVYQLSMDLVIDQVIQFCHYWTGFGCDKTPKDAVDCLPYGFPQ